MKSAFRGYYPPTDEELAQLWSDGLVILDTNALLNLFRYTEETRVDLLKLLSEKADVLWIPHQVGLEFHKNRIGVIRDQDKAFSNIESALKSAKTSVQNAIDKLKHHPSLDTAGLSKLLETSIKTITDGLATANDDHVLAVIEKQTYEHTFEKITELFDGKVGQQFSSSKLEEVYKDGKTRYEAEIPPGFKDQRKDGNDKYGDLVLWMQILEKGATDKNPAVFITDDAKEDWWYKVDGKTQGPRVELVDEYYAAAQQRIHFYSPDRFLAFAKERGSTISEESVVEAEQVSTARSMNYQAYRSASEHALLEDSSQLTRYLAARADSHLAQDPLRSGNFTRVAVREAEKRLNELDDRLASVNDKFENFEAAYDSGDPEVMADARAALRVLATERAYVTERANEARYELRMLRDRDRHFSDDYGSTRARLEALERMREAVRFDIGPDSED